MNAVTPETTKEGFELKPGFYTFGKLTSGHEQEDWLPEKAIDVEVNTDGALSIKPNETLNNVCIVRVLQGNNPDYVLCDGYTSRTLESSNPTLYKRYNFIVDNVNIKPEEGVRVSIVILDSVYRQVIPFKGRNLLIRGSEKDILFSIAYRIHTRKIDRAIKEQIGTSFVFYINRDGKWMMEGVEDSKRQEVEDLSTRPVHQNNLDSIPLPPTPEGGDPTIKIPKDEKK